MCGRFTLTCDAPALHAEFGIDLPADYRPRYNIAPTQPVLAVVSRHTGEWRTATLSWGLVPHWARDRRDAAKRINARAESLLEKPVFREAFQQRRCLIPADGFYEWQKGGSHSRPTLIRRTDGRPFAFAGLWSRWYDAQGSPLYTCSIVTTEASPLLQGIHDRMPVILEPRAYASWLARETDVDTLQGLLGSVADAALEWFPVSTLVNSAAHDSPACVQPL
ncbi:MAG: SOS response-associated peptidase [Longimicrobiales bacterium]